MSIDPRKGKKRIDFKSKVKDKSTESMSLELAFELFYSAKRTEGLRERTLRDYKSYWRYFRKWLNEFHAEITNTDQLTTALIREYVNYLTYDHVRYGDDPYRKKNDKKLSTETVKSRLRALQTICKFWVDENIISINPTEKIKPPRRDVEERSIISDDEFIMLLEAPDRSTYVGTRDRTLMMLLGDSGLRINEALSLQNNHIDFTSRCLRLPGTLNKNRKPRIVPISSVVVRELLKLIEETQSYFDTDFVFVSVYGDPLKGDHFRKQLRKYANAAGIDTSETRVSPHRFRDYFITNYLLNGGDLFTLQRIVAHADIKTTKGYVRLNEDALLDVHAQFSPLSRVKASRNIRKRL